MNDEPIFSLFIETNGADKIKCQYASTLDETALFHAQLAFLHVHFAPQSL